MAKKNKEAESIKGPRCFLKDCRSNLNEKCVVLVDNDFGLRDCPFYKKRAFGGDNSWNEGIGNAQPLTLKQRKMKALSTLITDMALNGATEEELNEVVKYSMLVIKEEELAPSTEELIESFREKYQNNV